MCHIYGICSSITALSIRLPPSLPPTSLLLKDALSLSSFVPLSLLAPPPAWPSKR